MNARSKPTNPYPFLARLAILASVASAAIVGIHSTTGLPVLFFQMALAIMMAHATELAHQCLHRTGTGSAFWDQLFGTMLSWPTGVCFQLYRWFHIWHHKENGSDIDAESFGCTYQLMQAPSRIARIAGFLRHISMADHFLGTLRRLKLAVGGKLAVALNAEAPHVSMGAALRIEREYQQMAFAYLALILVSVWTPALIRFWLIPLLMWGPFHALIELPEHWATAPRPNRDTFKNTRTIRAGWFANWLTNGNCYHVEHHEFAAVPMQQLPKLHAALIRSGKTYQHYVDSYPQFYLRFLLTIWIGIG